MHLFKHQVNMDWQSRTALRVSLHTDHNSNSVILNNDYTFLLFTANHLCTGMPWPITDKDTQCKQHSSACARQLSSMHSNTHVFPQPMREYLQSISSRSNDIKYISHLMLHMHVHFIDNKHLGANWDNKESSQAFEDCGNANEATLFPYKVTVHVILSYPLAQAWAKLEKRIQSNWYSLRNGEMFTFFLCLLWLYFLHKHRYYFAIAKLAWAAKPSLRSCSHIAHCCAKPAVQSG